MNLNESTSKLFQQSIVYRPFLYPEFEQLRQEHEKIHWVSEEVDMTDDVTDFKVNSSDDERNFIRANLQIFTTGDVVVAQNYKKLFIPTFINNEVSNWLTSVANRESEHQFAYALAVDTFGMPESTFSSFQNFQEARQRVDLMASDYDTSTVEGVALSLAHTAFNEGVCLFGAFAMLLSFNRTDIKAHNGMMGRYRGFTSINSWSLREENLHVDGAALLFRRLIAEHKQIWKDSLKKQIYDLAREVVAAEDVYIDHAFKDFVLTTTNKQEIKQYIRYMCDRRLIQLGLKAISDVTENPCPWIDTVLAGAGGKTLTNFFEGRVSAYQASGAIVGDTDWNSVFN